MCTQKIFACTAADMINGRSYVICSVPLMSRLRGAWRWWVEADNNIKLTVLELIKFHLQPEDLAENERAR